jgi:hypothetical protein
MFWKLRHSTFVAISIMITAIPAVSTGGLRIETTKLLLRAVVACLCLSAIRLVALRLL